MAGLAALTGLLAYAVISAMAHGSAVDDQVHSLSAENAHLEQQIAERQTQIGEAGNRDWLQEQARKLGFVFPGETIYILTTPGVSRPATGGVNAALPTFAPPTPVPTATPSPTAPPTGSPATISLSPQSPSPTAAH